MIHIPLLRRGKPYRSLDTARAKHYRTGEVVAEVSQANSGLIRRDLMGQASARAALARIPARELMAISRRAARHFMEDELPLGETTQTPQQYVEQLSATTGLPYAMARRNMEKIRTVLDKVDEVIGGLTRHLDPRVLDEGFGEEGGTAMSYYPCADTLGVVLPSNSPGVHALWAPATALKMPLALKPGSAEPWTPYRMIQAFLKAGAPEEAFGYYPADHAGGTEILRQCGRGMVFGDTATTKPWAGDRRVEVHGPGYSKIVIGEDAIDRWEEYLDAMAASVVENSGRSCVNASGIWVPRRAEEIAEALAERLARVMPRDAADEEAQIAPFANRDVAERISAMIDQDLAGTAAREVTAERRGSGRLADWQGSRYLLPTVVLCDREHALANREFLFPFASVVEVPESALPEALGHTLVLTAITENQELLRRLLASPLVGRLNIGAIPTVRIAWDQPHEGNLFEHLYARRAFQRKEDRTAA
ncbi:MAG: aldehyde dehydrogenase [Bryobacteraceae bacterium]|nr:aldehyde dehydrogenase [Bryobacteraceae bacterium]